MFFLSVPSLHIHTRIYVLYIYVFISYRTATFSYPTDHLREYLNNNNFNKIVFPKQKISFIRTTCFVLHTRQYSINQTLTKMPCVVMNSVGREREREGQIHSMEQKSNRKFIPTQSWVLKYFSKVTTIMRHAWQKTEIKLILRDLFIMCLWCALFLWEEDRK